MPRTSKKSELTKWVSELNVYFYEVSFKLYGMKASVLAENEKEASVILSNKYPEAVEYKLLFASNRCIAC